jgi:hypothetical protein
VDNLRFEEGYDEVTEEEEGDEGLERGQRDVEAREC